MNVVKMMMLAAVVLAMAACGSDPKPVANEQELQTTDACEAVLDNIATRVTIRAYQNKPVEKEKVDLLLRAGMAAPTALNAQPWHFIVIDDRSVLKALAGASQHTGILETAPMAIAVCGDLSKALPSAEKVYWIQDVSAATENILLAAHALGLGATWTGSYPVEERHKTAEKVLGLPEHVKAVSIIAIGYPAVQPHVKDKYKETNISYNKYNKE